MARPIELQVLYDDAVERRRIVAADIAFQSALSDAIVRGDERLEVVLGEREFVPAAPGASRTGGIGTSFFRRKICGVS
jgi:hypothetical protein